MPYKISVWIALFLLFFNGGAIMLDTSGAADYAGLDPSTCAGQELTTVANTLQDYDTGQGGGSTLFGLYNTISNPLEGLFNLVFRGGAMLKCAGVPKWIVNFLFTGLAVIPGLDLILFLRSG